MSLQQVPLTNSPNQTLTVNLEVDGKPLTLNLTVDYNEMAGYWIISISDINNNLLIDSIPMLCGSYPAANLLQQQRYLAIGSAFIINTGNAIPVYGVGYGQGGYGQNGYGGQTGQGGIDYPDNTTLGTIFQLWWDDTPSV